MENVVLRDVCVGVGVGVTVGVRVGVGVSVGVAVCVGVGVGVRVAVGVALNRRPGTTSQPAKPVVRMHSAAYTAASCF